MEKKFFCRVWEEEIERREDGCHWYDYENESLIWQTSINGKLGLIFSDGSQILPTIYDSISIFEDKNTSVEILVEQNNKYGIFVCSSHSGYFKIPIRYDEIDNYFTHYRVKKGNEYGLYAENGKEFIPCTFDNIERCLTKNDNISVTKKLFEIYYVKKGCKYGIYRLKYEYQNRSVYNHIGLHFLSIQPVYDKIEIFSSEKEIFKVYIGDKVGLVTCCQEICPPIYDDIYTRGLDNIYLKSRNSVGIITNSNKPLFINDYIISRYISDEYIMVIYNNKKGIIDEKGDIIIQPQYQSIKTIKNEEKNCLQFIVTINKKQGIIDTNGSYMIPAIYDIIECRSEPMRKDKKVIFTLSFDCFTKNTLYKYNGTGELIQTRPDVFTPYGHLGYTDKSILLFDANLQDLLCEEDSSSN